ncbi:hypothetical protein PAPYR_11698 [Paratrimastix pyriformis]|uniref:Uncharacterized protein n=1 Tax=Paratrimastix pyriformis TaxID=342808 RepID=A0ABQ8U4X6_9EUKA|nr:hypothetical protein PAPYR_11698 [Paratrimastix pyriformis]
MKRPMSCVDLVKQPKVETLTPGEWDETSYYSSSGFRHPSDQPAPSPTANLSCRTGRGGTNTMRLTGFEIPDGLLPSPAP